jgi:hypothetical protein
LDPQVSISSRVKKTRQRSWPTVDPPKGDGPAEKDLERNLSSI